ncbi:hypothetical protein [Marinovum sp.]|uniref:hypothetical protein n=1 Tax=Marinovum sp. TaxID=2024839 RepID=UPI002B26D90B|nr:hypothetical protein [Marinovum sp.]
MPTKSHQSDEQTISFCVRSKYDRDPTTSSAVPDQPAVRRRRKSRTRHGVPDDVGNKSVDLVKSAARGCEIAFRYFDDVIHQSIKISRDQRVADDAHYEEP